ncbi:hypothetical protein [Mycolicibacterium llatzerense]|uniref:hypothetical protein n=1 Tax=Mycolicibacterium llatzerense TaxID=280871 RepID=UPI0021B5841A|nr:hypothetical protein [Mycolicibacterium llatzerense]MCT7372740.1 hypothetical protein [Mycolicibacterium llatzerense]
MFTTQHNKPSTPRVPAEPVLAHVDQLLAAGHTPRTIAHAAGIRPYRLADLLKDRDRQLDRARRFSAAIANPIMAVPIPDVLFVPAIGPVRRLRALVRIGHPFEVLAAEIGLGYTTADLAELALGRPEIVPGDLADALAELFDRWQATPGDSAETREFGRRHRFAAPLAWAIDDKDTAGHIDDPDAQPDGLPPVKDPQWSKYEPEFVDIITDHRNLGHYDEHIAEAMGIPLNTLSKRLARCKISERRFGVGNRPFVSKAIYGARYSIRLPQTHAHLVRVMRAAS